MNDIIIPGKRIKTELWVLLYCYLAANILNVYSIIKYQTEWSELITWQPFILFLSVVFYGIALLLRLITLAFIKMFGKKA